MPIHMMMQEAFRREVASANQPLEPKGVGHEGRHGGGKELRPSLQGSQMGCQIGNATVAAKQHKIALKSESIVIGRQVKAVELYP